MFKMRPKPLSPLQRGDFLNIQMTLGHKIRMLAYDKKLNAEDLAYKAGVSRGFLFDVLAGRANPSLLILYRLSCALQCNIKNFL